MHPTDDVAEAADAYAAAPLLNCLLRELAQPAESADSGASAVSVVSDESSVPPVSAESSESGAAGSDPSSEDGRRRVYRLPAVGRLLRVRAGRRPAEPELLVAGVWHRLGHAELVKLTAEELRRYTGEPNDEVTAEMIDSRDAVAALLTARARATPPDDPYVRSEQSLITGHPYHPAPKARGGGPVASWLPYAPEAHARFPLVLLGVREDMVVEEGDTRALDALAEALGGGAGALPRGYRLLPAHPWQLELVGGSPELRDAFADGRLVRLGRTERSAWPTAAVRTLYVPGRGPSGDAPAAELHASAAGLHAVTAEQHASTAEQHGPTADMPAPGFDLYTTPAADLFVKFSLDVRITNDVRRLWRHDLVKVRTTDAAVVAAFAALRHSGAALGRSGGSYGADMASAAWLSDRGYRTAAFAFEELAVLVRDGLGRHVRPGATPLLAAALAEGFEGSPLDRLADPAAWWEAYLRHVVPPVLELFGRHGIVLEAHLQNTLVAVDRDGMPVQALFRDVEGVKKVPEVGRAAGWERLVYCLVVNHLAEIAGALAERYPSAGPRLWPAVRRALARYDTRRGLPEIADLLTAPSLPGKTNLLLRWTGADGADARYRPVSNPLLKGSVTP
ncbi:IucA/IucC family siderophore biosynthesis protein [Streptomyces sp. PSKA54]|uniref:IucA/IucC family siderophore biosynthesis protein n=1 Tax=Streptomyces himalayensis subsp. aureolus TaxID=2758039 RepID=A0A7W2HGD6_9ACTN|nr:IucA/IucC family protein [Streptomyces himalayensis]MBA4862801.1 IucA/IucC family siderophore biosynthesis protein [Streptomyces himalayensis subsp. aureolus]